MEEKERREERGRQWGKKEKDEEEGTDNRWMNNGEKMEGKEEEEDRESEHTSHFSSAT